MKKALFITTLFIVVGCSNKIVLFDQIEDKGEIGSPLVYFENRVLTGTVLDYHPDGSLKLSSSFRRGKLDGILNSWSEDSLLLCDIHFKKGSKNGSHKTNCLIIFGAVLGPQIGSKIA